MTTQRWLRLATALTALLLVLVLAAAWRSAVQERRAAADIGTRAGEVMDRIEARANALENAAGR